MACASFSFFLNATRPISGFSATGGRFFCLGVSDQSVDRSVSVSTASAKARSPRLIGQGCRLVGCGSAVPAISFSNDDLAKYIDTSDEWISSRTGIRRRRILTGNETLNGLAVEAARKALEMAKVDPSDVDLILVGSSTPDDTFGGGPQIQNALGCTNNPPAYDVTAGCSGFLLALVSGACHIKAGGFKNVLVIGADAGSRFVNWDQRETCVLFGDAAGAVLLQACDMEDDCMYTFNLHSNGDGSRHISSPLLVKDKAEEVAGLQETEIDFPPKRRSYEKVKMNGSEVFRFVCREVPPAIESALNEAGLSSSDIDWLLLHQANQRIMDAVATRLGIPPEKIISNLENYGNTSAASIPLALDEAVRSGKIKPGHTIATAAFGAGLTWGSAILRWG